MNNILIGALMGASLGLMLTGFGLRGRKFYILLVIGLMVCNLILSLLR